MIAIDAVPEQAVRAALESAQLAAALLVAGHRFIDEPGIHAVVAEVGDGLRVIFRSGHVSAEIWTREVAEAIAAEHDRRGTAP